MHKIKYIIIILNLLINKTRFKIQLKIELKKYKWQKVCVLNSMDTSSNTLCSGFLVGATLVPIGPGNDVKGGKLCQKKKGDQQSN